MLLYNKLVLCSLQLVVLPYNTLLHKSTRESCGIRLQGNVIIIDEGHNLLETISNIHSVEVTGAQVSNLSNLWKFSSKSNLNFHYL